MTTIIIIAAICIILAIGAINRKKLLLWVRSETNSILKEITNTVKVLELRISDAKKSINKMVDNAGDLFAQEKNIEVSIKSLIEKIDIIKHEALEAKNDKNNDLAKSKLELMLTYQKELDMLNKNLETIMQTRIKLESNISKLKTRISKHEIEIKGLKARQMTNNALKNANNSILDVDGTSLDDSINQVNSDITAKEFKLDYISNEDEEDENHSQAVEEAFENLK